MMGKLKFKISRWLVALLATVMVLGSLIGCGGNVDVNDALDVAIEVLEVVESLEAESETESAVGIASEISSEAGTTEAVETSAESLSDKAAETAEETEAALTVEEDGHYTSKEEVALYIHLYGKLPSNFISKDEAEKLGWKKKDGEAGQLHVVAPGMSIGGSYFGNYEGLLPKKNGRKYYECDINYVKGNRGAERIVYSNDGLIFYTGDHYETFEQLYPEQ